jgi:hypothetical protein
LRQEKLGKNKSIPSYLKNVESKIKDSVRQNRRDMADSLQHSSTGNYDAP